MTDGERAYAECVLMGYEFDDTQDGFVDIRLGHALVGWASWSGSTLYGSGNTPRADMLKAAADWKYQQKFVRHF